jgi:histidinol-phosphatase (PHP family)
MLYNLHTHSQFCDGKEDMEQFVLNAIRLGFKTLGFSGHSPLPFETYFSIKGNELKDYEAEILRLKEKYKQDITILTSLEIDYVPGVAPSFDELKKQIQMDYTIGSVHLVKGPNDFIWFIDGPDRSQYIEGVKQFESPRKAVETYYNQINHMLENERPDIVGHIDKVKMYNKNEFFTNGSGWYQKTFLETLHYVKEFGSILEINTRGIYRGKCDELFPAVEYLVDIKHMGIPIMVSSDAHKSDELLAYVPETLNILSEIGFKKLMTYENGDWKEISLKEYKKSINKCLAEVNS